MQVLMLSWEYPPYMAGGLGRHVAELAPMLAQQGMDVHLVIPVFTPQNLPVESADGVTVHRVFVPIVNQEIDIYGQALAANEALELYAHRLREQGQVFDLVHTHDWLTGFAAIRLKEAWNCPLVVTIHATERGRLRGHISSSLQWSIDNAERSLLEKASRVIVCSHYMFNEVQYFFQTPADKLNIVANGVSIPSLKAGYNQEELAAFRSRYVAADDLLVFTISRLVYEKGVHLLVRATPYILANCPQAQIIIAGKGPERENLIKQAEQLGVIDRVKFIGFVSDEERNRLFEVANCAAFPSLYEPFGIVALEAMALGCPVVVSDVGGLSEVVTHTENGVTVFPDNPDSVAWGILHILSDPRRAKQYARKAYDMVEQNFNWSRIARLTVDVYENVRQAAPNHERAVEII
jgi:glycosyltransferase involved in cell wall biosynthesis